MKKIKYFCLALVFAGASLMLHAKQDCVVIKGMDFKKIQAQAINRAGGQWTRVEIEIQGTENPDENANNKQWIRDVVLELTLVYKDEKASDKRDPASLIVMKAKAQLFAIQVGKKVPVVFYIPWEAYSLYRIQSDPYMWSIELSAAGVKIPLTKQNVSTMVSKTIMTSSDPRKVWTEYQKLVAEAMKANDGVLMPLNNCPFNVQYYEFEKGGNLPIPSYIQAR